MKRVDELKLENANAIKAVEVAQEDAEAAKQDAEAAREEARKRREEAEAAREEARKEKGPLMCEAEDFSEREALNSTQADSVFALARNLKNSGIDTLDDLMILSQDGVRFLLNQQVESTTFTAEQKQFLTSLKVKEPRKLG